MSPTDDRRLRELGDAVTASLDECIGRPARVAFLMYPYDGNVGNHMMFVALCDHLRRRRIRLAYAAHVNNLHVEALRRAIGDDPILFSGGVSLSPLWPDHVRAKREIAAAFPENLLVTLTSSILPVDADDERAVATIFGEHRHVVVMARDPTSAAHARRLLPAHIRVGTYPDTAFALPRHTPAGRPTTQILWLARDDHEGTGRQPPTDVTTFDWSHDLRHDYRRAYALMRATGVASRLRAVPTIGARRQRPLDAVIAKGYERASRHMLAVGHRTLDRGAVLVTDRMHPHVFAALRGQPVVVLPDRFGKNRAVFDYSTSGLSCVHWADDGADALRIARSLASR